MTREKRVIPPRCVVILSRVGRTEKNGAEDDEGCGEGVTRTGEAVDGEAHEGRRVVRVGVVGRWFGGRDDRPLQELRRV